MMRRFRIDSYDHDEFTQGSEPKDYFDDLESAMEPLTAAWNGLIDGAAPEELTEDLYGRTHLVVDTLDGYPVRIVTYYQSEETGQPVARVVNLQDGSSIRVEQAKRRIWFEGLDEVLDAASPADLAVLVRMIDARQRELTDEEATKSMRQVRVELLENCIQDAAPADLDCLTNMIRQRREKRRSVAA